MRCDTVVQSTKFECEGTLRMDLIVPVQQLICVHILLAITGNAYSLSELRNVIHIMCAVMICVFLLVRVQ